MTTPKYKESARSKQRRLGLSKPHILWSRKFGEWLYRRGGLGCDYAALADFCRDQDHRWTPRSKK